jgi:hypothetical protein
VDELHQHLSEQIGFLRKSATAFDQGDAVEAKRLVPPIRLLVHQTSRSDALLHQLGVLEDMTFLDTAGEIDPANMLPSAMLTALRFSAGAVPTHHAMLSNYLPVPPAGQWRPFSAWWTRTVIKDGAGAEFSRRDLILAVAHKDGGVHVDQLQEAYERLSRSNSLGWVLGDSKAPLNNPVLPSIRQIAFEVEQSIVGTFPELSVAA